MRGSSNGASSAPDAEAPPGTADAASGPPAEAPPDAGDATSGPLKQEPADTGDLNWSSAGLPPRGPATAVDRITVALVAKAAADLRHTHDRTRLSETDIVNRALSLYEFIDAELAEGAELIIRRGGRDNLLKLI